LSSTARVSRVSALTQSTTSTNAIRIVGEGVSPILTDVEVSASTSATNNAAIGLSIVNGATPIVRHLSVVMSGSPFMDGVFVGFGAAPVLEDAEISVRGCSDTCTGVSVLQSSIQLTRSRVVAQGHFANALEHSQGGTAEISYSHLSATASSITGIGIQETGGALLVEHSTVEGQASGQGRSIYAAGATVQVAMSRLGGPILNGLPGFPPQATFTCLEAYNENLVLLNRSCE
jgi:hypothetical protein